MPRPRALNAQILLEILCCTAFAALTFTLIRSGAYLDYVTPRMKPYLYFTAAIMLVWAGESLTRLFRPRHKTRWGHCFVLALPMLLLLLPHDAVGTAAISAKYVAGSPFPNNPPGPTLAPDNFGLADETSPAADGTFPGAWQDQAVPIPDLPGLDRVNQKIVIGDDDFYPWLNEIYLHMEAYTDYTVVVTGFVLKDPELMAANEFVPARLGMSCCVADLAPYGILCQYDRVADLQANEWVTVEGALQIGEYLGYPEPQIRVNRVTPTQAVEGYFYPFF
jgi:putative membrane protein